MTNGLFERHIIIIVNINKIYYNISLQLISLELSRTIKSGIRTWDPSLIILS